MKSDHLIAVDIGNTNITMGLFINTKLTATVKVPTNGYSHYESHYRQLLKHINHTKPHSTHKPPRIIISSVVPIALCRFIAHLNKINTHNAITIIGRDIKVPIKNLYRNKKEVGQDRLVNAYAAKKLYGSPAVVIDFGTAATFDIVSQKGAYLGGLIMPGIDISLRSLYERTALLPKVELEPVKNIIGTDTVSSMRGGILFGFGAMCDGLIERYKKILGTSTKIIVTGGNGPLVMKYSTKINTTDTDLTLKGLSLIDSAIKD